MTTPAPSFKRNPNLTPGAWLDAVSWNEQGLVPVIAQEFGSGDVLMMAWMNRDALLKTMQIGEAVYWSRSRQKLWQGHSFGLRWRYDLVACGSKRRHCLSYW
jgi:phosphoribosyl-AMP cyclohydrolase